MVSPKSCSLVEGPSRQPLGWETEGGVEAYTWIGCEERKESKRSAAC